jgi:hypothetical protein
VPDGADATGHRSGQIDLTLDTCGSGWTRSVELENRWGRKAPRGSNPRPSAICEITWRTCLPLGSVDKRGCAAA